ncbi:hypothetical protein PVAP13_7NG172317 [Panicum virgatum]|uniref:Uncharacterized protein n=1 Tax=Panicum virgatum TaxID=38727 RepID=A0A8T0Q230_PANVG|nr:hypothetical protein PVAP13_7NG172317 [Panicum virgatum]
MRRTAAAANGRPSSPPPSSPPPQLLLPHLHTFAFMAATTSTPSASPSPSSWPPAPHLQTVAQHLSVCSFPATPFSFSISSSFPLPIFSRVCLLLRIDLVKLMISSPAPPRCRVLRHHLSIAEGISSLPQTLEVFCHQAEQSKDRVTNKDPILSDWILFTTQLLHDHYLDLLI